MSTVTTLPTLQRQPGPLTPPLHSGDRLTQRVFHARYEQYPDDVKFELIGGVVYMASPARLPHGKDQSLLAMICSLYASETPGVEVGIEPTVILGDRSEPQPDLVVRVQPEYGGASQTTEDQYIAGPPELIIEIAHSSVAIDLGAKKDDYRRAGVREYIVWCIEEQQIAWFDLPADRRRRVAADGILRSREFAGLWIDVPALAKRDGKRLVATLRKGLKTAAHRALARRLSKCRTRMAKAPVVAPSAANRRQPSAKKDAPFE